MLDFIANAASASFTALWMAIICAWMDWDFMGALFTLNMLGFGTLAIGGCLIAVVLWVKRHVRVVII